jgi:hypothetical protein
MVHQRLADPVGSAAVLTETPQSAGLLAVGA